MAIWLIILIIMAENSSTSEEIESCKGSINFNKMSQNFLCDTFLMSTMQNLLGNMNKLNKYLEHKVDTFKIYKAESCDLPKFSDDNVNCPKRSVYPSCKDALAKNKPGAYLLDPEYANMKPIMAYCELDKDNGLPWTVIQRRVEKNMDLNFERDYIQSFGRLYGSYWMGLENIHRLTTSNDFELWIELSYKRGPVKNAKYSHFGIGSKAQNYNILFLGNYTGDAGDGLRSSVGYAFSTSSSRHTDSNACYNLDGGWWYGKDSCFKHLLSTYNEITWMGQKGDFSKIQMAIREKVMSENCS